MRNSSVKTFLVTSKHAKRFQKLVQEGISISVGNTGVTHAALEPCGSEAHMDCGVRDLLERLGDKWTVLTMADLSPGPRRFRQLQRAIFGISQRMLTLTLRRLERDGLVSPTVFPSVPPQVTYALTEQGKSLTGVVRVLVDRAQEHQSHIQATRHTWDKRAVSQEDKSS